MKKLCLACIAFCFSGFSVADPESSQGFNPDEITYVVTMSTNDKSVAEVDTFSSFYYKLVEGNEPSTLA